MKKITILLLLFIFTGISFSQTTEINSTTNLYYLCKIWGYLKYFHTEVGKGEIDWDEVLIQNINHTKIAGTENELNIALLRVINAAGTMVSPSTSLPDVPAELMYNLNLTWIENSYLPLEVREKLNNIETLYRPFLSSYYSYVGDYKHNSDTDTENMAKRYLALFKYWNIINYFFPYKNIMEKDWEEVLKEFIIKIGNTNNADSYYYTMLELFAQINDAHASTQCARIDELKGLYYLPLKLKYVEGKTVVSATPNNLDDFICKRGDIIRKINGKDINIIRDSLRIYTNGSNKSSVERNINNWLIRRRDNYVRTKLEIENETGIKTISLMPVSSAQYSSSFSSIEPAWKVINNGNANLGYIHMGRLSGNQIPTMFDELWNCNALIFDIRNYPQGTLWDLIGYLFPQPIHGANFTIANRSYPGTFNLTTASLVGRGDFSKNYNKPIYLLFDEDTQSQAEYMTMHLEKYPKAVKIGSQTAGADGNTELVLLPFDISTYYSGMGVFYPDGRPTQRIGIVPNIEVKPTIQGIRDGRDEVLEAALNHYLTTDIEKPDEVLMQYTLMQNYPNPFNPATTISFTLPKQDFVTLKIFDSLGREVETLISKEMNTGRHSLKWNAAHYPSGVYLYQINAGNYRETKKLVLLK
jgi:carboxyl-terminal processing protease